MSVRTRWLTAAAVVVCVAAAGTAVWWPERPVDPAAYSGSDSRYTASDIEWLTHIRLPGCALPATKYYIFPLGPESVWFDFAGSEECVDEFLTGLALDGANPGSTWDPRNPTPLVPLMPPAESGARWEPGPADRVDTWSRVVEGGYDEQVDVVVNRSAQPWHVYVRAFATN